MGGHIGVSPRPPSHLAKPLDQMPWNDLETDWQVHVNGGTLWDSVSGFGKEEGLREVSAT
jgi:hypothetical protein